MLSYLYYKSEGTNQHKIQFHGLSGHTQEAKRFRKPLEEMCDIGCIEALSMDHVTEGRIIYRITAKGKDTTQMIRDPLIKNFLGLTEENI